MTIHFGWLAVGVILYAGIAVCAFPVGVAAYMDTRDSAIFLAVLTAIVWPLPLLILLVIFTVAQIRGCFR